MSQPPQPQLLVRNADNTVHQLLAQYTHSVTGTLWYIVVPYGNITANDLPHARPSADFTVSAVAPGDSWASVADAMNVVTVISIYGDSVRYRGSGAPAPDFRGGVADSVLPTTAFVNRFRKQ